jgi:hypothetical protein
MRIQVLLVRALGDYPFGSSGNFSVTSSATPPQEKKLGLRTAVNTRFAAGEEQTSE